MATLFDRISTRLARVRTTESALPVTSFAPVSTVPAEAEEPMTLESLEAALDKLATARAEQLTVIYGAEAERDRIMDDPDGDDSELLRIRDRVALAQLSVDRIARLEDEALEQLQPLRAAKRQAAWEAARDQFCSYARKYYDAMQELERCANQVWAVRQAVFSPLGLWDWEETVPRLPRLMRYSPAGSVPMDSVTFEQEMARFSKISINGPAPAVRLADRLTAFVHGRADATVLDRSAAFGSSSTVDDIEVLVRLARDVKPDDGEVIPRGAVVRVSASHARELIAAGRAVLSDPSPERGVGGMARTLPLPAQSFNPEWQE